MVILFQLTVGSSCKRVAGPSKGLSVSFIS